MNKSSIRCKKKFTFASKSLIALKDFEFGHEYESIIIILFDGILLFKTFLIYPKN